MLSEIFRIWHAASDARCSDIKLHRRMKGVLTMLRFLHILIAVALVGCTQQFTETRLEPGEAVRMNEALYVEEPQGLYNAFRESCSGPGSKYTRLGTTGARCRLVPTPDVAAELLIRYDGALDIPFFFVERQTRSEGEAYVISLDYFASVPLKNGHEQRVYLRSTRLDRQIDQMFRITGGTPI